MRLPKPSLPKKPPDKLFRSVSKRHFIKHTLGNWFGGSVKGSLNPLKRKDVREVLEDAEVLSMLDPTVSGKRTESESKLTKKESVNILKKIKETVRKNLQEKGYGIRPQGKYRATDPERAFQQTVTELYREGKIVDPATARQQALDTRLREVRRREFVRKELGLSTLSKLAQERDTRREQYQKRLETQAHPKQPGTNAPPQANPASPQAPAGSAGGLKGFPRVPSSSPHDLPADEEDDTISEPPVKDNATPPEPPPMNEDASEHPANNDRDTTGSSATEPDALERPDEKPREEKPSEPTNLDDNLPL